MRRLAALLVLVPLAAGCGSDSGSGSRTTTQTVTTTDTGPPPPTPTEPKPTARRGERIDIGTFFAFKTPSGRIGCGVTTGPSTLRCDTAFQTRFSHSGHTCQFGDYGQSFEVKETGAGEAICAGDTVLSAPGARTIPYGKTWLVGPYTCTSRTSGLTCRNGEGHGMALSLQAQKIL